MGRLSGFRYRDIVRMLRVLAFEFDRRAAASHEIWFNSRTNRYTARNSRSEVPFRHINGIATPFVPIK